MSKCGECGGALNQDKGCRRCKKLAMVEIVSNEPLREHFLKMVDQGSSTIIAICRHMQHHGFPYVRVQGGVEGPDSTRLRRQLGLARTSADRRTGNPGILKQYIDYEEAVALCGAFGLDPHEAGV